MPHEIHPSLALLTNSLLHMEFWGSRCNLARKHSTPWQLQEANSTSLLVIITLERYQVLSMQIIPRDKDDFEDQEHSPIEK